MSIYANTDDLFFGSIGYGVTAAKDFSGHKSGNPPRDASRVIVAAFAKAAGAIAPVSVNFVKFGPDAAKIAASESHTVDIITFSTMSTI